MTIDDMILDWNALREVHPDRLDMFNFQEYLAAEELCSQRAHLPEEIVQETGLDRYETAEQLLADREKLLTIAGTFSGVSIYDVSTKAADDRIDLIMTVDNLPYVSACITIDILSRLWHVSSGLKFGVVINFQDVDSADFLAPGLSTTAEGLFPDMANFRWNILHRETAANRPMEQSKYEWILELVDGLDEELGNTITINFPCYLDDDSLDNMKIWKTEAGYAMRLVFNMDDFGWDEPLILGRDDLSKEELIIVIKGILLLGVSTGKIRIINRSFKHLKE